MGAEDLPERDFLLEVVKRAPMLASLREASLSPRDLQANLDVSKSTVHRNATSLTESGLLTKADGEYTLTELGRSVADVVSRFETDMETIVRLSPMLDPVSGVEPPCPIDAFADATITTTERGDPFGPMGRFLSLVSQTDSFRMADSHTIAPAYIDEIRGGCWMASRPRSSNGRRSPRKSWITIPGDASSCVGAFILR